MIDYRGGWGIGILFRIRGSVFPRALLFAVPSAALSFVLGEVFFAPLELEQFDFSNVGVVWSGFTFILGFLIVFRTQQAYNRFWTGASLLRRARGAWFNATSCILAFTTNETHRRSEVEEFQHLLVRLMSMLHRVALQTVADTDCESFEFIDYSGMDVGSLRFLASLDDKNHRSEVLVQWLQQLVVSATRRDVVNVSPPIVTRFFHEMGQGMVDVTEARNMTDIPFPFPYVQMMSVMLVIHLILTPFVNTMVIQSPMWACIFTFATVLAYWGTNFIAAELESPFGDDANDLPLAMMQREMNNSLWVLLEQRAQRPPHFDFSKEKHRRWHTRAGSFSNVDGGPVAKKDVSTRELQGCPLSNKMGRSTPACSVRISDSQAFQIGVTPAALAGRFSVASGYSAVSSFQASASFRSARSDGSRPATTPSPRPGSQPASRRVSVKSTISQISSVSAFSRASAFSGFSAAARARGAKVRRFAKPAQLARDLANSDSDEELHELEVREMSGPQLTAPVHRNPKGSNQLTLPPNAQQATSRASGSAELGVQRMTSAGSASECTSIALPDDARMGTIEDFLAANGGLDAEASQCEAALDTCHEAPYGESGRSAGSRSPKEIS